MTSLYRLPCVYCKEGVAFPSSEKLKEHLLASHKSLVCGGKSTANLMSAVRDEKSGDFQRAGHSPNTSHTTISYTTPSYNTSSYTTSSYVTPSPNHLHQLRSNNVVDVVATMQEKKIVRLKEILNSKETAVESLKIEIENLKSDSRIKDEEHSRIRQLWRKEAEDALRTLKTSYEDVLTQKRLIDKQLIVSEQDKEKLRSSNDTLEKELATLNATIANEKRNLQMKEDAQMSSMSNPAEKNNQSEKDMLVADLQQARKEKKAMSESLKIRNETLSKLQNSFSKIEIKLSEEEKKNNMLNEELGTVRVKYDELNAQQKSVKSPERKNDNSKAILQTVNILKEEKTKLLDRLREADKSLLDLSKRVHPTTNPSVKSDIPSEPSSTKKIDHINLSLDEIKSVLKMLPQRNQSQANNAELRHLQVELQQANLQLVEEKAKVLQMKSNLTELKDMIADDDYIHTQHDAKQKQLQHLRSKHQHCIRNEKLRRQVQREKKLLQRKHSTLQKQYQMLSALYQSSQSDLSFKEQIVAELATAKKSKGNESKALKEQLESSRNTVNENKVLLEKYKRESSYLLEKLNTGAEEKEELKKKNESLEQRLSELSALNDVKKNLDFIRENLIEIKSTTNNSTKTSEGQSSPSDMDVLTQRNIDLADKILSLQYRLSTDQQEFEKLQRNIENKDKTITSYHQQIERLENKIASESSQLNLQKSMKDSEYESKIENLTLEKEILTSRVLILEGIREEMDALKEERNHLKDENQKLRRLNKQRSDSVSNVNTQNHNRNDEILVSNEFSDAPSDVTSDAHFEENLKKLDDLDENTKSRLQQMLSTPEFETFLSTDDVYIDLKDSSQQSSDHSSDRISNQDSLKNLSADSFESEHMINHMYQTESGTVRNETLAGSASFEDVIQVYTPITENTTTKDEDTNGYIQDKQTPRNTSDLGVDTPQSQSTQTINLEKLVSESQLISKNIASKTETSGNIDYKKVLNELQKVITEMSGESSSQSSLDERKHSSLSRQKKVTFSDHVVDFYSELESEDTTSSSSLPSMESSDSNFYRSFFHDALKKTYPELTKEEEEENSSDENKYFDNLSVDQILSQNSLPKANDSVVGLLHNDSVSIMATALNPETDTLAVSPSSMHAEDNNNGVIEPSFDQILEMVSKSSNSKTSQSKQMLYDAVMKTLPQPLSISSSMRSKTSSSLPTLNEEEETGEMSNIPSEFVQESYSQHGSKTLNVLESFVNNVQCLQDRDNLITINRSNSFEFDTLKMISDENVQSMATPSLFEDDHQNSSKIASEFTLGSIIRGNLSFDESGEDLFRKNRSEDAGHFDGTSFDANSSQASRKSHILSTPSAPSNTHKPATLDFSDGSLLSLNSFSNLK